MKNIEIDDNSIRDRDTEIDKENNDTRIYKSTSSSLSCLNSKSKFYFAGSLDNDSASKEKSLSFDELENNEFEYEDYDKKIEELEIQIMNIKKMYDREVSVHEEERLKFKELVEVLKEKIFEKNTENQPGSFARTVETKHFSQMRAMQSLIETIVDLQNSLENML